MIKQGKIKLYVDINEFLYNGSEQSTVLGADLLEHDLFESSK
jgi:hypothetical protein